jgi:flagella basal body P-ring formation protein FlgA
MKIISVLFFAALLAFSPAGAMRDPEQKVAGVIKDYVITKNPQWFRDEIKVSFRFSADVFNELQKLPEETGIRVVEVYPEFRPVGNVIFPLEIKTGETAKKVFVRAKVEVDKKVIAAAKLIKRGKVIEAADLKIEERDIALLPQKYFVDTVSLVGKEAKINMPANGTIFEWMVGDLPLFRRGSAVTIVVASDGIKVKARGEALEDGYLNAQIKVKRKESRQAIVAKVISPTEVEVKL